MKGGIHYATLAQKPIMVFCSADHLVQIRTLPRYYLYPPRTLVFDWFKLDTDTLNIYLADVITATAKVSF